MSLLFSDIEGSTVLLARLGSAYVEALTGQRQVLRRAWSAHDGTEMGTEGDSFFVVFPTAPKAVAAAVMAQRDLAAYRWPAGEVVRVRIGVHTGAPAMHDGGYVGMDVHRAARIASASHGGQVVISSATAELVQGRLPNGVRLRDLGSHQLKDLPSLEHLLQLDIEGLPRDFPPLKTVGAASSLPAPPTPMVGRDRELVELDALLGEPGVRLVTLTGPGGSGKTRLGVEVARRLIQANPDGVYFVSCAAAVDGDGLWASIADALGVAPENRPPAALRATLAQRPILLVLDNLEQVVGADAVVEQLLQQARKVSVIVTSRRPLHLAAEHEYALPALELPAHEGLEAAERSAAIQLFVQQARRVRSGFRLTPANSADVVAVCRRVDGLPLAIEVAAARLKLLSPRALLGHMDAGLDLTTGGGQGSSRQRTLRSTIAWSYDLLSPQMQGCFRRFAVFSGGADLDAIREVVIPLHGSDRPDPLDVVAELVDASLVTVAEAPDGEPRVEILRTIRAFALDQLSASSELRLARDQHARHYLGVVEKQSPLMQTDRRTEARTRLATEHDNVREALGWLLQAQAPGEPMTESLRMAARLCKELLDFWVATGQLSEAGRWAARVIESLGGEHGADSPELASCLQIMSGARRGQGDMKAALTYARASVAMCRRLGDPHSLANAFLIRAAMELHDGQLVAARLSLDEACDVAGEWEDPDYRLNALCTTAILEGIEHHWEPSYGLYGELLELATAVGNAEFALIARHNIAELLRSLGRLEEARSQMLALLPDELRLNEPLGLTSFAEGYAALLADLGDHAPAIRLFGAADEMRRQMGIRLSPQWDREVEEGRAKSRTAMPKQRWNDLYESGRAGDLQEMLRAELAAAVE